MLSGSNLYMVLTEPTSTVYDSYAIFLCGNEGTLYPVKKCIGVTVLVLAILAQDGYFLASSIRELASP